MIATARDFWLIVIAYVAATVAAVLVLLAAPLGDTLLDMLLADVVATLVVFGFSVAFSNSSFYDAYWSVAPPLLLAGWVILHGGTGDAIRTLLAAVVVLAWAARLTRNWAIGWEGLSHADWRYVRLREQLGIFYWPVSLLGIHMMPTLLVFAGCLPLYLVSLSSRPLGVWDAIGLVVHT